MLKMNQHQNTTHINNNIQVFAPAKNNIGLVREVTRNTVGFVLSCIGILHSSAPIIAVSPDSDAAASVMVPASVTHDASSTFNGSIAFLMLTV